MNFSLSSGNPLAYYKDDSGKTQIIYSTDDSKASEKEKELSLEEITDMVEDFIRNSKGRISMKLINDLQESLKNKIEPKNKNLKELYNELLKKKRTKYINVPKGGVIPMFNPEEERKVFHIAGMSGSGKSTFVSDIIENYHKIFPKNKVWFFSNKPSDPAIDKHKFVVRVELNDELVSDPIDLEELRNSLVVYDDVEYVKDKDVSNELDRIRDLILQQGRSYHISFAYITHLLNNYKESRIILNECHCSVLFPRMTTTYSLKYLLEKYYGMKKEDIQKLKSLNSRWVCVQKIPPCVIYDKGAYMLE